MSARVGLFAFVLIASCSDASGTVRGGEPLYDAAQPVPLTTAIPPVSGPDSTFGALYRDFFGPTGKGNCSGTGACHGDASQPGAQESHYICDGDRDQCWSTMTSPNAQNDGLRLVTPGDISSPGGLEKILRKASGGGRMPLQPATVVFTDEEIGRIRGWIQNGAMNDG